MKKHPSKKKKNNLEVINQKMWKFKSKNSNKLGQICTNLHFYMLEKLNKTILVRKINPTFTGTVGTLLINILIVYQNSLNTVKALVLIKFVVFFPNLYDHTLWFKQHNICKTNFKIKLIRWKKGRSLQTHQSVNKLD